MFSAVSSKKILCLGDTATLMAFGGDVYQWKPAANLGSPNDSTTEAFPDSSTKYEVIIEDSTCGITDSLSIQLPVVPKPKVTITKSNDINCILGEATLHADGGGSFLWQPSTGISDTRTNQPVVRINSTTTYFLTVTTAEGCEIKDSITVNVVNGAGSSRFPVPTAFTPNNDGKNDCFGVQYWGAVSNFSMSLFNRWGNLVFYTSDPTQCWNGIYNGQRQPGDTYIYLIKAKTPCGDVSRKGTFTLIR
ncbi:MAG: gliding motility-associated C-terminal domain-containing protein [Chitinophagaceae bacterium]|nr:MAG: gliding motility-associated C-terminal domain-containing protein [Chitinophagaceae bacterium]